MTELLALILGLQLGYWGRTISSKVSDIHHALRNRIENPAGVVKPNPQKIADRSDDSPTGPVRPPDPKQYAIQNQIRENELKARV